MLNVAQDRHRWRKWIEDVRVRDVLNDAAKGLEWAWKLDKKDPQHFPVNTWYLFVQTKEDLENRPLARSGAKLPPASPPPQRLSDLLDERTIKAVYENHNEGIYEDALKKAAKGYGEGRSAWRKLARAIDTAYLISHCGIDFAPRPRVHFLHRELLEITNSEHLRDLSLEGIVEFFDDVCPCGREHKTDAIRKLRKRAARRRPKS